jgi:hypothetical protein
MTPDDLFLGSPGNAPKPKKAKVVKAPPTPYEAPLEAIPATPRPKPVKHTRPRLKYDNDAGNVPEEGGGGDSDYQWSMQGESSDTAKALEAFLGSKDPRTSSELDENQIRSAALLLELSGRYRLPRLRNAVNHFLHLRVSKGRASRNEAVSAFTGLVANRQMNQQNIADSLRREV